MFILFLLENQRCGLLSSWVNILRNKTEIWKTVTLEEEEKKKRKEQEKISQYELA